MNEESRDTSQPESGALPAGTASADAARDDAGKAEKSPHQTVDKGEPAAAARSGLGNPAVLLVLVLTGLLAWQWYDGTMRMSDLRQELATRLRDSDTDSRDAKLVARQAQEAVREGAAVHQPLKKSGEFPPMVVHMIAVGERTGELASMLERVSKTYESQVNRRVETLTALLEPLMILFMGGIVFVIALAVLLPMLQMNQIAGG